MEAVALFTALLPLFNVVVEDFRYVKAGFDFDMNYQTDIIRLGNLEWRINRWGESVGLKGDAVDPGVTVGNVEQAKQTRGQIHSLLTAARRQSQQYGDGVLAPGDVEPAQMAADENTRAGKNSQADEDAHVIMRAMRRMSIKKPLKKSKTTDGTTVLQKAEWALGGRDRFEDKINSIAILVNDLVDLFPAAEPAQQELAREAVEELGPDLVQQILDRLAEKEGAQDRQLEEALEAVKATKASVTRPAANVTQTNTFGTGNSGFQNGYIGGNFTWSGPN